MGLAQLWIAFKQIEGKPLTDQEKGCKSKSHYPNRQTAERYAEKVFKTRQVQLRVYNCPHCHKWHLTKRI